MPHAFQASAARRRRIWAAGIFLAGISAIATTGSAQPSSTPVAAVFPQGGDARADQAEQVAYARRSEPKCDAYAPLDRPTIGDTAAGASSPIDAWIDPAAVQPLSAPLSAPLSPAVLVWGELDMLGNGSKLILNLLNLQPPDVKPLRCCL
jgi:hypothetical protein